MSQTHHASPDATLARAQQLEAAAEEVSKALMEAADPQAAEDAVTRFKVAGMTLPVAVMGGTAILAEALRAVPPAERPSYIAAFVHMIVWFTQTIDDGDNADLASVQAAGRA